MWNEKVVVVAGGSKGLGLHIANEFHARGAIVVLCARTKDTVDQEVSRLNTIRANSAHGHPVDLGDKSEREKRIAEIIQRHERIDVWVNAVGQSIRTEFQAADLDSYRQLMESNFFTSVGCSLAVLPYLQQSEGYLINVGSLAAKTAWPLVSPYVASKHALAGFAHQLRIEGPQEVHYLFVCPGPIAGSDPSRYQEAAQQIGGNANKPGAGAPVKAIDPNRLASKIVDSCERRKSELIVPFKSRFLFSLLQIWPELGDRLIRKFRK